MRLTALTEAEELKTLKEFLVREEARVKERFYDYLESYLGHVGGSNLILGTWERATTTSAAEQRYRAETFEGYFTFVYNGFTVECYMSQSGYSFDIRAFTKDGKRHSLSKVQAPLKLNTLIKALKDGEAEWTNKHGSTP